MCRRSADALQLPTLPRVMECFDISNISTTHVVASMVCFRDGVPDKDNYRRYRIRTVEGQDDFASMAEVVRRRYSRVLLEARADNPEAAEFSAGKSGGSVDARGRTFVAVRLPDLIIVDGGKGQLSSACRELQRLGLHELPIIGLAKEFEEIYRPGRALPLLLPHDSGALALAPADPRRSASFRQRLPPAPDEEADRREHSRRLPGREPESQEPASAKVRLRPPAAQSQRGRDCCDRRNWPEASGGCPSFPGAALISGRCIYPISACRSRVDTHCLSEFACAFRSVCCLIAAGGCSRPVARPINHRPAGVAADAVRGNNRSDV